MSLSEIEVARRKESTKKSKRWGTYKLMFPNESVFQAHRQQANL